MYHDTEHQIHRQQLSNFANCQKSTFRCSLTYRAVHTTKYNSIGQPSYKTNQCIVILRSYRGFAPHLSSVPPLQELHHHPPTHTMEKRRSVNTKCIRGEKTRRKKTHPCSFAQYACRHMPISYSSRSIHISEALAVYFSSQASVIYDRPECVCCMSYRPGVYVSHERCGHETYVVVGRLPLA